MLTQHGINIAYDYSYHESDFISDIYIKVNRLFTQVIFLKKQV